MKPSSCALAAVCLLLLGGCGSNPAKPIFPPAEPAGSASSAAQAADTTAVPEGATADADGFVRMPGEPSRGSSDYYVTGDVCEQFTVRFMEGLTGKKILRAEAGVPGTTVCQYFTSAENANRMFQIGVEFLSVENQKKGNEFLDRKVAPDTRIPMENFVVTQEDGLMNQIYLVLGPQKFISINRSSATALTEAEVMDLAIKLGGKVKEFK